MIDGIEDEDLLKQIEQTMQMPPLEDMQQDGKKCERSGKKDGHK